MIVFDCLGLGVHGFVWVPVLFACLFYRLYLFCVLLVVLLFLLEFVDLVFTAVVWCWFVCLLMLLGVVY